MTSVSGSAGNTDITIANIESDALGEDDGDDEWELDFQWLKRTVK